MVETEDELPPPDDVPPPDEAPPPDDAPPPDEPGSLLVEDVDAPPSTEDVLFLPPEDDGPAPISEADFDAAISSEGPRRRRGSATRATTAGAASSSLGPPANLDLERALLSALLVSPNKAAIALDAVQPEDFYDRRHRLIFGALRRLLQEGDEQSVDIYVVLDVLEREGVLGDTGGEDYLLELVGVGGSALAAENYARRIAQLAAVRRVLTAAHRIQARGYERGVDPDSFVSEAQQDLQTAVESAVRGHYVHIGEVVGDVYREILAKRDAGGDVVGISTGFRDIDRKLMGLHGTDLFILAARPAMGKTALALNIALNVARGRGRIAGQPSEHPRGVLFFSMEMGRDQLVQRLLSQLANVGLSQIRSGKITVDDEVRLREAGEELAELPFYIDDEPALSPVDVRARAKRVAMRVPLALVAVDYLQLMRGTGGRGQSREQEISEISRSLKGVAKELNTTVLALSQLNRGVESRADKRPMMSDLRESGAIEQDADIIAFVFRGHYYFPDSVDEHRAELIIAKHRAGEIGNIELHFDGSRTRFSTMEDRFDDRYAGQ